MIKHEDGRVIVDGSLNTLAKEATEILIQINEIFDIQMDVEGNEKEKAELRNDFNRNLERISDREKTDLNYSDDECSGRIYTDTKIFA